MKKKSIFIVIGLLLFAAVMLAGCTSSTDKAGNSQPVTADTPAKPYSTIQVSTTISTPVKTVVKTATPTLKADTRTLGERNAARKALDYLRFMPFSRDGLIKQLEYEGFTHQEAVYGVDQSGANWNEQAALKAEEYLKLMSFSRSGLIDQLEYEGFTPQQAEYGVRAVGY
jgi:hypothetical protein